MIHLSRVGISVAVVLTALLWWAYLAIFGERLPTWADAAPFSFVVGGLVILGLWFEHGLWHARGIRKLVGRPVMRGTWKGELAPAGADEPIPCFVAVTQSYSRLQMHLMTEESVSWLVADDVRKSSKNDGYQVVGVYTNQPRVKVRERSAIHRGTLWLETHGAHDLPASLSGEYWTDRGTMGALRLDRRTDEIYSRFDEAVAAFDG
jgi:hypothetical protein